MSNWRRFIAVSNNPIARWARKVYWGIQRFSVPAPRRLVKPILWAFLAIRECYYFFMRVFICEPLFKAYCAQYGRNLHTGVFIHWIQGKGDIIIGDDVIVDGKVSILFAARFSDSPTLRIGDRACIGHDCSFTIGKSITLGNDCYIAGGSQFLDTSGHPIDPAGRLARLPPAPEEVRPIEIGDNVWIGGGSLILPGVKIGEGSVVAGRSVVRYHVRPYTIVAGNPARKIADLPRPAVEPGPSAVACAAD